jgi:hypothetical protein
MRAFYDADGNPVLVGSPTNAGTNVDGTSASAQSAILSATVDVIARVCAKDDPVTIRVGTNPSAVDTDLYLPANTFDYFSIPKNHKIAIKGGIASIVVMG